MQLFLPLSVAILLQHFAGEGLALGRPKAFIDITTQIYNKHHYRRDNHHHLHQHRQRSAEDQMARIAFDTVSQLNRRQDTGASGDPSSPRPSSPNGNNTPPPSSPTSNSESEDDIDEPEDSVLDDDLALWNEQTSAACLEALRLDDNDDTRSNSPAGISVCYNLPFLDRSTGVFQAELRMYNISTPVDEWQGVVAADIALELSYVAATAQLIDRLSLRKRNLYIESPRQPSPSLLPASTSSSVSQPSAFPIPELRMAKRQNEKGPEEIKVLSYIGQVDEAVIGADLESSSLQPFVVPTIKLSARNPSGIDIDTTLDMGDSSFINGIFASGVPSSTFSDSASQASASAVLESINADASVEIPGVELGVFPIGMIITLIWTAIFVAAVGYGAVTKIQFRNQYRRRRRRDVWRGAVY